MRFKYYLRGCGLGILLATLILTIGFHRRAAGGGISDTEVMQRASQLGMVVPEDESTIPVTNLGTEGGGESAPQSVDEQQTDAPGGTEADEPDRIETDEPNRTEIYIITVTRGEVCREIAEDLYEKGLVDEPKEFQSYMKENGFDSMIQVGDFEIAAGMSYEEIAKIITTKIE